MSLLKRVKQQAEQIKQEKNEESRKRLRSIVKGDRIVVSPHFPNMDITENEILDYLKYKILEVAPLHNALIATRIERVDRDITAYCDGRCIYVGHKFFLQSKSYMYHTIIGYFSKIITGMYREFLYETSDVGYVEFLRVVKSIVNEKIVNSLMLTSYSTLGLIKPISELVDKEYLANVIYENCTYRRNPFIDNYKSAKIQAELEDNCKDVYKQFLALNGSPTESVNFTLNISCIGDSVDVEIYGDALVKQYTIKNHMKNLNTMSNQLKNLELLRDSKDKVEELQESVQERRKAEKPLKLTEDVHKPTDTPTERDKEISYDKEQYHENIDTSEESQDKTFFGDKGNNIETYSNSVDDESDKKSIKGWDNLIEKDQLTGEDKQDELQENGKLSKSYYSSPLDSVSEEVQQQVMNEMAAVMPPDLCMEWIKQCNELQSGSIEQSFNILIDLMEDRDYTQEQINDMLDKCQSLLSSEETNSIFKEKFNLEREKGIKDMLPEALKEEMNRLSANLSDEEMMMWNEKIQEKGLNSIEDYISTLFELAEEYEDEDESEKDYIENKFSRVTNPFSDMLEYDDKDEEDTSPTETLQQSFNYEQNIENSSTLEQKLQEEFSSQLPPDIVTQDEDIVGNTTEEDGESSNLSRSEYVNTQQDTMGSMAQNLDTLDEDIEELRNMIESLSSDSEMNTLIDTIPSITESAIGEQETSDVVDVLNHMMMSNTSGMYGSLLKQMSITNAIVQEYYDISHNYFMELEDFMKSKKPNKNSTFERPNKKFVYRNILLPSKRSSKLINNVEFIRIFADTSASMSDKDRKLLFGVLKRGEKMFPKKTEVFEFNDYVRQLKVFNGKILDNLKGTGGTRIDAIFPYMPKHDSGRCINIIISDGGFSWSKLESFLKTRKQEIVVVMVTSAQEYSIDIPKSRFKIINIEDNNSGVKQVSSIKAF